MFKYQEEELRKKDPHYINIDNENILIQKKEPKQEHYISLMGSMSHTYGNVLAFAQNFVLKELFPENLFKTIHVNSMIAHRQIRGTNHEFIKKNKPMIIFRPRIGGIDEDVFLKGTPLIERQSDIFSTWGSTALQPFFEDDKNDLRIDYQQNRSVLYVDIIAIFSTLMNQIDYVHYLRNATRWNIPFVKQTCLESYIPQEMLQVVSELSDIPLYDEKGSTKDFLDYMEQNSATPITYKLQGSTGTREFYRYYPTSVHMLLSDLDWDSGEKVGHIMDQYQINFTLKLEFWSTGFYYIFNEKIHDINLPFVELDTSKVIPIFTDVLVKEDLNLRPGWHLFSSASYMLETENDEIELDSLLNNSIRYVIKYHKENGLPFGEFFDIKIRRQGELMHPGIEYKVDMDNMKIQFIDQNTFFTYRILICINAEYVNDLTKRIFDLK